MPKSSKRNSPKPHKKVFIVEDHPIFREGLVQMVNGAEGLKVCGEASNAEKALRDIPRLEPDLVLIDITLPGKSGLELIKALRSKNRKVKLLVVSMHDEALYADRVLRAGGDGYIMKQEDSHEIIDAIRDVLEGHIYVSEEVMAVKTKAAQESSAQVKPSPMNKLTDSELEILNLLGKGRSNVEIGRQLKLSVKTIAARCAALQKKLKLKSTNALICHATCWTTGIAVSS